MTKKKQPLPGLAIYTDKRGKVEFRADIEHETLWASQAQIAQLFGAERSVITKHIRNILNDKELSADSVCANFAHTAADGKKYTVQHYNLDVILAVGYRTNSKAAISFRKWATATLREHITKGFTVNRVRIGQNYDAFMRTVADVQALLPEHVTLDPKQIIELIKEFASTWVSLDAYDKDELKPIGTTKRAVALSGAELTAAIMQLRDELGRTGAVTELFAQERVAGSVVGIVGNVMQSFGGQALYPSVEEKAAHLLYFMVKNHPFSDGNKRSGAFAFVWFLRRARGKKQRNITPAALTALTLLIAESKPDKKNQMIALVTQLLR